MTPVDDALQAALANEHRIVFGYGMLGPRVAQPQRALARSSQAAHAELRDQAITAVTAAGLTAAVAAVDYPDLGPVDGPAAAIRLAIRLETSAATAWRFLFAQSSAPKASRSLLALAQDALTASAIRATRWRVAAHDATPTEPFPGI